MSEVEISRLDLQGKEFLGVRVEMLNAPLLLIKGKEDLQCGLFKSLCR